MGLLVGVLGILLLGRNMLFQTSKGGINVLIKVGNDLYLPRGDTGKLRITVRSNHESTTADRVLFTIKKNGIPVIVRSMVPVDEQAIVEFTNEMTKGLAIGDYQYDIRYVRDAVLDDDDLPIGGDGVDTPRRIAAFHLVDTAGDV